MTMAILFLWFLVFATLAAYFLYVFWTAKQTNVTGMMVFAAANGLLTAGLAAFPQGLTFDQWDLIQSFSIGIGAFVVSCIVFIVIQNTFASILTTARTEIDTLKKQAQQILEESQKHAETSYMIDLSALMLQNIAGLINSTFLEGHFFVPRFVVDTIQQMSVSNEALASAQGAYGTQAIEHLNKECILPVSVTSEAYSQLTDYETKTAQFLRDQEACLLTANHNLARRIQGEGLKVIYIPNIQQSIKPVYFVGQKLTVQITSPGQEPNQGAGYLEDGTKVIVDGAANLMQQSIHIIIRQVFQTVSGKVLFGTIESQH